MGDLKDNDTKWITTDNGIHVPIENGESKKEAIESFFRSAQNEGIAKMFGEDRGGIGKKIDMEIDKLPIYVKFEKGISEPRVEVNEDGHIVATVSDVFRNDPTFLRENYIPRAIENEMSPLPKDVFIRSVRNEDDYRYLMEGKHVGSKNWNTGEDEGGLSVSRSIEFPSKYAYYVRGKVIGQGSDGEPLLETATAKPVGKLMTYNQMYDSLRRKGDAKARKMGAKTMMDLKRRFIVSRTQIIMPKERT